MPDVFTLLFHPMHYGLELRVAIRKHYIKMRLSVCLAAQALQYKFWLQIEEDGVSMILSKQNQLELTNVALQLLMC